MTLFPLPPPDGGAPGRSGPGNDEHGAAPSGPLRRVVAGLSYDGSAFRGFAAQHNAPSVAARLSEAIGRVCHEAPAITCAGRTDAGVHSLCQVVHFDLSEEAVGTLLREGTAEQFTHLSRLESSLRRMLRPEIDVLCALLAPTGFDARRSALSRRYRYELDTGERPRPLRRHEAWHVGPELDLSAMRLAADALVGEHDFGGFCRKDKARPDASLRRRVLACAFLVAPESLTFEIEANAFCHQMVRSIVGMLVAIGGGRRRPSDLFAMLRAAERAGAPNPAPPEGLTLVSVAYPEAFGGRWSWPAGPEVVGPDPGARRAGPPVRTSAQAV